MRLPPLNAVRAFDAVARLGSVRAAADELAVTPAAVSQQLRVLEAHLGLALTQRQGRGLALTDSGRTWHGEIARHLRAIALAAERVRPGRRVVQVTVVQSFGSRWLMPRLTKFTAREPEIEVRIDASPVLADFARDPFDLAIREGRGAYPDTELVRLFELEFFPVASPRARAPHATPRRHARLVARAPPARSDATTTGPTGSPWPTSADVDVARGLFFSHTMLALDAAVEGQGVALAPPPFAERELARGALDVVDPRGFAPGTGIYLCWPRRGLRTLSPAATAFRDWVIEEAQATRPQRPPRRPSRAVVIRPARSRLVDRIAPFVPVSATISVPERASASFHRNRILHERSRLSASSRDARRTTSSSCATTTCGASAPKAAPRAASPRAWASRPHRASRRTASGSRS